MKSTKAMAKLLACGMCALLAAGPLLAQENDKPPGKRWKLKYEAGSAPFAANQSINVMVRQEDILLLGGNRYGGSSMDQAIPVEDVTQITYDSARGRYASKALAGTASDVQSGADLLMYVYFMLPLAIVTLPFKGTRHFVTIEWTEGSRHRAVVLRMKAGTAKEFLAELEQATGKTARDLDRERAEFRKQQQAKAAAQKKDSPASPNPER